MLDKLSFLPYPLGKQVKSLSHSIHLSVKAVSILAGVSPHTLRAWEKRYRAVEPRRSDTGRRVYRPSDVERLRLLVRLVDAGHSISTVASRPDSELAALCESLPPERGSYARSAQDRLARTELSPSSGSNPRMSALSDSTGETLAEVIDSIRHFNLDRISECFARSQELFHPRTFALEIIGPILSEMGVLVDRGVLGISQEHLLSVQVRGALGAALEKLDRGMRNQPHALALAGAEGDMHEFGLLLGAILCASRGIRPLLLGPNLPPQDFAEAVRKSGTRIALLGTTPLPPGEMPRTYEEYLTELESNLPPETELWLGGRGDVKLGSLNLKRDIRALVTLEMLDHALSKLESHGKAK